MLIIVNSLPEIPIITKNENTLTSSVSTGNQWYLDNASILGATNQTYIYTQNGKYWVSVTNEFGCTAVSEEMDIDDVGIAETHCNASLLRVYPNPTSNQLKIKNEELREKAEYTIYSIVGQVVMVGKNLSVCPENNEIVLDVSHLASGMYFLKIDGKTVKFVKQ